MVLGNGVSAIDNSWKFDEFYVGSSFKVSGKIKYSGGSVGGLSISMNNFDGSEFFLIFLSDSIFLAGVVNTVAYKEVDEYFNGRFVEFEVEWDGRYLSVKVNGKDYGIVDSGNVYDFSGNKYIEIMNKYPDGAGVVYGLRVSSDGSDVFWIDADDYNPYEGVWRDRVSGKEGQWVGLNKVNGYEVVSNHDGEFGIKNEYAMYVALNSGIKDFEYWGEEIKSSVYTLEGDIFWKGSTQWFYRIWDRVINMHFFDSSGNKIYDIILEDSKNGYEHKVNARLRDYINSISTGSCYKDISLYYGREKNVKWQYVIDYDSGIAKLYCCGELIKTSSVSFWIDWSKVAKMLISNNGVSWGNVRVYNRVLSEDELLYNLNNWDNPIRDGLVFWVRAKDIDLENYVVYDVAKGREVGLYDFANGSYKIDGHKVKRLGVIEK